MRGKQDLRHSGVAAHPRLGQGWQVNERTDVSPLLDLKVDFSCQKQPGLVYSVDLQMARETSASLYYA